MSTFGNQNLSFEALQDGENVRSLFYIFLNEYQTNNEEGRPIYYYREEVSKMIKNKRTTLYVDFRHLMEREGHLMEAINFEFYR